MTTFYFIRHGANDFLGKAVAGRLPGVHLNELGRRQADKVAERLAAEPIRHIFSSPMERCQETAAPLAHKLGLPVQTAEALIEVGYGDWTGKALDELRPLEAWKLWNSSRTGARIPNGEMIVEIQARMAAELVRLHRLYPNDGIAIFSHGDPIRTVICYILGIPLDFIPRFEISPGSITTVAWQESGARVLQLNESRE